MNEIDTIVFDLGGVLIDWNPRRLYEKIFRTTEAIDYFLGNITSHDWNEQQDAGRPIQEANQILIDQHPHYTPEIEAYYAQWEAEMLGDAIAGSVDILDHFINHTPYRVLALTNWSAETFPVAQAKFPFLKWFEGILVSGEVKLKKPDPAIYRLLSSRYNVKPHKSIFIDDSKRNISGAQEIGFNTIHFLSPEQLKSALQQKNLM